MSFDLVNIYLGDQHVLLLMKNKVFLNKLKLQV